jgi:hypothetical protein
MLRTTPELAFAIAQEAMGRGDWEGFFECLDQRDLLRLAPMVFDVPGGAGLCLEHGIPADAVKHIETLIQEINESGRAMLRRHEGVPNSSAIQCDILEHSARHQCLIIAVHKAIEECLEFVPNLALFTAKAERLKRATLGGGSVGSTLFVGESLCDLKVHGWKASGVCRRQGGSVEPIAFVLKKGLWYIRFFSKAPSRVK